MAFSKSKSLFEAILKNNFWEHPTINILDTNFKKNL